MGRAITKPGFPVEQPFMTIDEVNAYFDRDELTCLICGGEYEALYSHLSAHDLTGDQYRETYGIPWSRGLAGRELRKRHRKKLLKQRKQGRLPKGPSQEQLQQLHKTDKRKRPISAATQDAWMKSGLRRHNRTEKWSTDDFKEYIRRVGEGRTLAEVGEDPDMPCRQFFDKVMRNDPEIRALFEEVWRQQPYEVQARGQRVCSG